MHKIAQSTGPHIDLENFKWLLVAYDMPLDSHSLGVFMQQIDGGAEAASISSLLDMVIPHITASRQDMVCSAYHTIQGRNSGSVTLKSIATQFNPSTDPHVMDGSKTEEQVFNCFMKGWETKGQEDTVSTGEFSEYYKVTIHYIRVGHLGRHGERRPLRVPDQERMELLMIPYTI